MTTPPGKISWVVAPAEPCVLCRRPILTGQETSTWNDKPAHSECVKVHMLQRHPVFRDWSDEPPPEAGPEDDALTRSDDDEDEGWPD